AGPGTDEGRSASPALRRRYPGAVLPRQHGRAHAARTHDQQRGGTVGCRTPVPEWRARDRQRDGARDAVVAHSARRRLRACVLGLLQEQDRRATASNPPGSGRAKVRCARRVSVPELGEVGLDEAGALKSHGGWGCRSVAPTAALRLHPPRVLSRLSPAASVASELPVLQGTTLSEESREALASLYGARHG